MSPNRVYFGLFLFLFVVAIVLIALFHFQKPATAKITTFEQCAAAGYPVMQSYPPQCTLPSGKFFVQQLVK